jgi:integrase/recombinase XerD
MSIVIPRTPFERAALRYIRHQRALGMLFSHQAWGLGRLARHLSERKAQDLDASQFEAWLRCQQHTSGTSRRNYALVVHKFCRSRQRTEPGCFVPDPLYFPRRVPSVLPVILGPTQIARMLETIEAWPVNPQHPLYRATYRIAVVLLYTAGLRRGELVRLTLNDADLTNATLRIRESKFHKTRLVPLSSSASRELRRYLKVRLAPPWDISADAPLLGDQHGSARFRAYVPAAIGQGVHRLFRDADIRDPHGRYPRVHDLRHSFAVQALLRWYRAGVDVQAKLPQLSMYMGHVSIVSTAHYLHFIPEVASAAHRLFARHFGHLALGGAR